MRPRGGVLDDCEGIFDNVDDLFQSVRPTVK